MVKDIVMVLQHRGSVGRIPPNAREGKMDLVMRLQKGLGDSGSVLGIC